MIARSSASWAAGRRRASTTSSSSTRRARRSPSPRATGSRSRSGCASAARIAGALHATAAATGQAALFRRHPARRRRLSRGDREAAGRGTGQGAGERGLAHPRRRGAGQLGGRRQFRHAAQPRGVAHTENKDVLWQYLRRYVPGATPETAPLLDRLLSAAMDYYEDFVKAAKNFRRPTAKERDAIKDLAEPGANCRRRRRRVHPERGVRGGQERRVSKSPSRAPGSPPSTKSCWAREPGSPSAPSSSSTAATMSCSLIERALAGEDLGKAA